MNKYKLGWIICLTLIISFMGTAFAYSIDFDGYCRSGHECMLVHELGKTEYLQYLGRGNPETVLFVGLTLIPLLAGMLIAKLEEGSKVKND